MVILSMLIVPDLKDYRTEASGAPSDSSELLGMVVLLVQNVGLIEYLLSFSQANAVPAF